MHNDRSGIIFPLLGMTFLDFIENDEFYPLSVENMEEITLKALDAVSCELLQFKQLLHFMSNSYHYSFASPPFQRYDTPQL
jgi:hypothetical protein